MIGHLAHSHITQRALLYTHGLSVFTGYVCNQCCTLEALDVCALLMLGETESKVEVLCRFGSRTGHDLTLPQFLHFLPGTPGTSCTLSRLSPSFNIFLTLPRGAHKNAARAQLNTQNLSMIVACVYVHIIYPSSVRRLFYTGAK